MVSIVINHVTISHTRRTVEFIFIAFHAFPGLIAVYSIHVRSIAGHFTHPYEPPSESKLVKVVGNDRSLNLTSTRIVSY